MKKILLAGILLFCLLHEVGAQKRWNVYVFLAEECPICNYMAKGLKLIATKYADDVSFHAVFPMKNSNYKTAQLFKEQYGLDSFQTLLDNDQAIAKKLGATITPEVIITDEQGEILYRGRINSAFYAPGKMKHSGIKDDLDNALASLRSESNVAQPWPPATGCYITMHASL